MRTCKLEHCEEKLHCGGYCNLHYKRSRTGVGLYKPKQIKDSNRGCSVEGCPRKHIAKGMCGLHASRIRQNTPLDQKTQNKDGTQGCSFSGCQGKHSSHGYCKNHWERVNKACRKARIVQEFGGTCHDCGGLFPDYCFDFDNVSDDPGHTSISQLMDKNANMRLIEKELKRCEMVCANCHRIRTNLRYSEASELKKHANNS